MSYGASFTITSPVPGGFKLRSGIFNFAIGTLDPPGAVPDVLQIEQEELTDPGVIGRRWRILSRMYAPFNLLTVADAASYSAGLSLARDYRLSRGALGTLTMTLDSVTDTHTNVKILDVMPQVHKGFLVGNGADGSSAVIVRARWALVLADASSQGSSS